MYQDRFMLTSQDILDKEFKIDTRGYRPQEVDKYLDVIIRDYNEFNSPDIDSTPDNNIKEEDDIDQAPVLLSPATGIAETYTILALVVVVIIAVSVVLIKKFVIQ